MSFLAQTLGFRTMTLASTPVALGNPLSQNVGIKSTDRIAREALEADYRFDSTTFNIINKQIQIILHAGFEITTKAARWQKFYDDFFNDIGKIGDPITIQELVEYTFQDMIMYGNAFVELVYDAKTDSKIIDLKLIPEKKMDYAKNNKGDIMVDNYGRPVGYVMTLPYGYAGKGDPIPKEFSGVVSVKGNEIFFLPKRIAHFKLFTYGDRFYGIGLIEPAHTSTRRKLDIEEARTNEIYTRGANTVIATVGDETHEAGPQEIKSTLDILSNMKHDRYMAFPHWTKVGTLDATQNSEVEQVLGYLRVNQAASAGMPLAFATGSGEATNRSTLNNQQQIMQLAFKHLIGKFKFYFEKFVLAPIAKTNRIGEVAKIEFGELRAEEKDEKFKRLLEARKLGDITPEEFREFISRTEDVVMDEAAWKKAQAEKKKEADKIKASIQNPTNPADPKNPVNPKANEMAQLSEKEMLLGGFYMPSVRKEISPGKMSPSLLTEYHDNLHALWQKRTEGFQIGWTFGEIAEMHQQILNEFTVKKITHIAPINDLDKIDTRY